MRRPTAALLLVALAASPLAAQNAPSNRRFPRKYLLALAGAAVGGAISGFYALGNTGDIGGCSRNKCVVPITVAGSGFVGYLIGGELDHLYRLRYAHAPPLRLEGTELPLSLLGNDLAVSDQLVFVTGEGGVELVHTGPGLRRVGLRAKGLRGIGPVTSDTSSHSLLVGTGVGLYRFALDDDTPGTLARSGEISAASGDGSRIALGMGTSFQVGVIGDSLRMLASPVEEDSRIVDAAWVGDDLLWVLSEDRLASYRIGADGAAELLGADTLPATARKLAIADTLALVSGGTGGVFAIAIGDPATPRTIANWSGARFAYDAAFLGARAYVAAGPEGLYVIELTPNGFVPRGLARQAGFVAAVEVDGASVYLLDRTGGLLRRIPANER